MRVAAFALLLLAPLGALAQNDAFIVGVQTPGGDPIPGASVLLGDRGAATDADGQATFEDLAPGRYVVRVSFVGKATRRMLAVLEPPGPWGLIVELADAAQTLEVVVEARSLEGTRLERDGFFQRQALGSGTVLTAADIREKRPILLTDVMRGVLGVRVRRGASGPVAVSGRSALAGECQLRVYLDGAYSPGLSDNLDALSAQGVVAVEVYRGASQVPTQYNQLGVSDGCGVALVWTELSTAEPN